MYAVKLNIQDEIFDKFQNSIKVDDVPYYPSISFEEAQQKVANSVRDIPKGYGEPVDKVFDELLSK
jgi:hypothetical protein